MVFERFRKSSSVDKFEYVTLTVCVWAIIGLILFVVESFMTPMKNDSSKQYIDRINKTYLVDGEKVTIKYTIVRKDGKIEFKEDNK